MRWWQAPTRFCLKLGSVFGRGQSDHEIDFVERVGESVHLGDLRLVAEAVLIAKAVERIEEVDKVVEEAIHFSGEFLPHRGVELTSFVLEVLGEEFDQTVGAPPCIETAKDGAK